MNVERPSFIIRSHEMLHESVDRQEARARIPESYKAKGMFLDGLAKRLGKASFDRLAADLIDPPRNGRYTTFRDYPQRDHFTLTWAVYQAEYPTVPAREGLRRIARQDFLTFGNSMIGRVVLGVAGDPIAALLQMPSACAHTVVGQVMKATQTGPSSVQIEVLAEDDGWERTLGQIEGVVAHYRLATKTKVSVSSTSYTFEVEAD